jgi:intracellular septation protein
MQEQPERKAPARGRGVAAAEGENAPFLEKLIIELGPLLVFFGVNAAAGIYAATAAFMAATVASLGFAQWRYRKLPVMPLVSGVVVLIFGGLTLYLRDETFIKLKPTLVYLIFAFVLGAGLLLKKPLLELLLGSALKLTDYGWRMLTVRWTLFFIVMAVVNEIVWRNFSTNVWVSFKAFGFLPLTFLFAVAQVPLLQRHALPETPRDGTHEARSKEPEATT